MSEGLWQRWTAYAGLGYVVLQVIMTVLFFVGGPPPPVSDTARWAAYSESDASALIWIGFVNGLSYTVVLPFVVGVRRVLDKYGELAQFLADVFYISAIASVLLNLVGGSLLGSVGLDAQLHPEPTALRALYEAGGPIIGVFAVFPLALMLVAAAAAFQQTQGFPRTLVWFGYLGGILSFVATFALFGGTNTSDFFTSTGTAGLVLVLLPVVIWIALVSVALLRPRAATSPAPQVSTQTA
jgi:hypothetical protein